MQTLVEIFNIAHDTLQQFKVRVPEIIGNGQAWEYSRRINLDFTAKLVEIGLFNNVKQDNRSLSYSVDIAFKGLSYTLTLFMITSS